MRLPTGKRGLEHRPDGAMSFLVGRIGGLASISIHAIHAWHLGDSVGFFGAAVATQQSGTALTAGATYGATEQSMLNKAYGAMRTYGLLT